MFWAVNILIICLIRGMPTPALLECIRGPSPKHCKSLIYGFVPGFNHTQNRTAPQPLLNSPTKQTEQKPPLLQPLPIPTNRRYRHHDQVATPTPQPPPPPPATMHTTTLLLSLTASFATTAFAEEAYAPAPAANASMTTQITPANCTSACTTIIEPCTEAPTGTAGTGGMLPVTSGTWVMPTGPTAAPTSGESDAPPAYTGAAVAGTQPVIIGGILMAAVGMLPALV